MSWPATTAAKSRQQWNRQITFDTPERSPAKTFWRESRFAGPRSWSRRRRQPTSTAGCAAAAALDRKWSTSPLRSRGTVPSSGSLRARRRLSAAAGPAGLWWTGRAMSRWRRRIPRRSPRTRMKTRTRKPCRCVRHRQRLAHARTCVRARGAANRRPRSGKPKVPRPSRAPSPRPRPRRRVRPRRTRPSMGTLESSSVSGARANEGRSPVRSLLISGRTTQRAQPRSCTREAP